MGPNIHSLICLGNDGGNRGLKGWIFCFPLVEPKCVNVLIGNKGITTVISRSGEKFIKLNLVTELKSNLIVDIIFLNN